MSNMRDSVRLEDIDQLLDELEQLARSNVSQSRFLNASLNRLVFLLNASACAIMARPNRDQWVITASCGAIHDSAPQQLLSSILDTEEFVCSSDSHWLAVPIRKGQWQRGALVVHSPKAFNAAGLEDLVKLCQAFAEVLATRQLSELEYLLDEKWASFQRSLLGLANALSAEECAYLIVNDIASLVKADRVSLVRTVGWGTRVLAISGVVRVERKSTSVNAIVQICKSVIASKKSVAKKASEQSTLSDGELQKSAGPLLGNHVCIPMTHHGRGENSCNAAMLFEWSDYEAFLYGCTTLNYLFPPLVAAWQQQLRMLALPYPIRRLLDARSPLRLLRWSAQLVRLALILAFCFGLVWIATMPSDLRIEAEGTLQPVEQRIAYASMDGVVNQLLVSDGQQVDIGETLVEMRSPMLELQLQEVLGDIRANAEKKDGLNLAINQLSRDEPGAFGLQGKLSSEVRELEIRMETLLEKRNSLINEQKKLVVRAPIAGTVVARQVERFLDSRPVRQGEALLRVVKLDGPWRLELQVSDQDSGYVKEKLFAGDSKLSGSVPTDSDREWEFALVSRPANKFTALATWMSESARNPRGEGMFVELMADVGPEVSQIGHMGATVNAYCNCGKRPMWFVWTRQLVEAIQRKLWF